ncbi:MAG: phosphatase PAP2 family protein [Thermodesulfobacteriota bacterium]
MTSRGPSRQVFLLYAAAALIVIFSASLDSKLAKLALTGLTAAGAEAFSLLGNGGVLLPVCLILMGLGWRLKREHLRTAGRETLYALLISGVTAQILKAVFERPRIAHAGEYITHALTHPSFFDLTGRFNSFPSGHTATAFAMAAVLGKNYPRLRVPLYLTAILIGLSRIVLGSHYASDVTGGAVLGLAIGWLLVKCRGAGINKREWITAGLALLVISICFFKLGGYLVFDVDEAVFSEASREMVVTGDLITPSYNFEPRYDKPILFYWAMSGAFKLFGTSEFSARFTSAALGAALVLITFLFVRRFRGFRAALWASLVLLLNLEFFVYSHSAVTDMTLAFFISGALFSAFSAVKTGDKRLYMAFWVSSALAMLTKGAIGLLFPVSITFIYLLIKKDFSSIKRFCNPLYIILFLLIASPWFVLEYNARGWEFIDAFIIKHHIHRFTGVISSHGGPPYFYVLILLAGFFPWVTFLPEAIIKGIKGIGKDNDNKDIFLFTTIWFLFIFIFFSISRTKLPNYIFPSIPACSVLVGVLITLKIERGKGRGFAFTAMALLSFILSATAFLMPHLGVKMEIPLPSTLFTGLCVITLLTGIFSALSIKNPRRFAPLIAASSVALLIVLRLGAIPPVNVFMQQDLYNYALYAKNTGAELATYEINQPSIAFYYAGDKKILKLEGKALDKLHLSDGEKMLIITKAERVKEVEDKGGFTTIDKGREFALMSTNPEFPSFTK